MNTNNKHTRPPPVIYSRKEHCVSRSDISESALKVLYRLKDSSYDAYLVGGGVRDLLLGRKPKDFDVATDAHPEQAHKEFRNSRLIGRRFRLLHVRYGRDIVEVATFRAHHDEDSEMSEDDSHIRDGMLVRDNVYGNIEDDAWRRDFTINALFYNIRDYSVIDYTGGMQDIKARLIRVIGDPAQRYREDPVRMLRAIRFAAKLDFAIEEQSAKPIAELKDKLQVVPPARLFDEVLKLFLSGHALRSFDLLREYDLFRFLFPITDAHLNQNDSFNELIRLGLRNTDIRIAEEKPVTPAFLFAILLWRPVLDLAGRWQQRGMGELQAIQSAGHEIFNLQAQHVALPRRFTLQTSEIWTMQDRLLNRSGKRAFRLFSSARFRAGYDFLLLRQQSGEEGLDDLCEWWTQFQVQHEEGQHAMVRELKSPKTRSKSRRRRKRKPRTQE